MTFTLSVEQIIGAVITAAALLGALAYLVHLGRKITRWLRALTDVVQHELTPNHGTSIKDDVSGVARSVGVLARNVDTLAEDFEGFKTDFYHHLAEQDPRTP